MIFLLVVYFATMEEKYEIYPPKKRCGSPRGYASGAYYAMFYVAQALLWSRGVSFSKHSAVIARFGQEFAKTKKLDPIYHRYLRDGFETRQIADYGVTEDITRKQASELIRHAGKFLREARAFLRKSKLE
ncbi:MAG: HEPN domain-containing protein [candidate division KSB1 bacterium]|nr:HEPN domain-containing protein [candidate division KSB1 bacterium]